MKTELSIFTFLETLLLAIKIFTSSATDYMWMNTKACSATREQISRAAADMYFSLRTD